MHNIKGKQTEGENKKNGQGSTLDEVEIVRKKITSNEIARALFTTLLLSVLVCVGALLPLMLFLWFPCSQTPTTTSNNQGEGRYFYRYSVSISSPSEQRSIDFPWYDNQFLTVDLFALRTEDQETHHYVMGSTLRRIRSFCYLFFSCLLLLVGEKNKSVNMSERLWPSRKKYPTISPGTIKKENDR